MLHSDDETLSKINGESFNLCFDEQITLLQLINKIKEFLKIEKIEFLDEKDLVKGGKFFYPSVECGPISNLKAKNYLNFKSSSLD